MIIAKLEFCLPYCDWVPHNVRLTGQAEEDYRKVLAEREADEYSNIRCDDFPSLAEVLAEAEEDCKEIALDSLRSMGDPNAEDVADQIWVRFVGDG